MKYVVTGGAGFIGSHLVEAISKGGANRVVVIDNFEQFLYSSRSRMKWAEAINRVENVEVLNCDYSNTPIELLNDADVIFNCAAIPGLAPSFHNPEKYWSTNHSLLTDFLDVVSKADFNGSFVHLSTSSVYGRVATVNEVGPTKPISPYGESKLEAEHLLADFQNSTGTSVKCARLFSVYGPRQRTDMAYSIFIRKMLAQERIDVFGDGNQSRTNTFVADVCEALRGLESRYFEKFQVFNVAGNESITVNQAIDLIAKLLDVTPKVRHLESREGDQRETRGVTDKLTTETGWLPKTSILEGLNRQISSCVLEGPRQLR